MQSLTDVVRRAAADDKDDSRRVKICRTPFTSAAYATVCPSGEIAGSPSYSAPVATGVKRRSLKSMGGTSLAAYMGDTVLELGATEDFIGHIGGDDFVLICGPERADDVARRVVEAFDAAAPEYYTGGVRTCTRLLGFRA